MICDKLKEIRERTGMNKKEFSNFLEMKYTTYNNYETGAREPASDFLILISEKFDVSIDYILGLKDNCEILHAYQLKSNEYDHIKKYRALDEHGKDMVDTVLQKEYERRTEHAKEFIMLQPPLLVPYYGHVASAGTGQYVFDDIPPEMIEIENEMDKMHVDFAIGVNGDSMEPTYHDGDTLLIKKQSDINIGEIGIFMINGEAYVKELGDSVLISHNKKYKDIPLTNNTICIGKVISTK